MAQRATVRPTGTEVVAAVSGPAPERSAGTTAQGQPGPGGGAGAFRCVPGVCQPTARRVIPADYRQRTAVASAPIGQSTVARRYPTFGVQQQHGGVCAEL